VLDKVAKFMSILVGLFVFYTAAFGPFESLVQRALFLAMVICLGLAIYPLGRGTRWRPIGIIVDFMIAAATLAAATSVIIRYDEIMTTLMWASTTDKLLTIGLVVSVLELGRRSVGIIFPVLVTLGISYALWGDMLPGSLAHRGFDTDFITETILLGDLGVWGMLLGIASTVIAAFVLFGALLLHTGSGQTFMDMAMRLGGSSPGGAAKVGTIASGLFGMVSGSSVANVATTGNFTIPMMLRLGYPRPFAAAVEAVASTGGQIAPPIMGAAAFVMAEILGVSYLTVMSAAILPALLFYGSVFMTVHVIAVRKNLGIVPKQDLPSLRTILAPRSILPFIAAMGGLVFGIVMGRSVATAAFYGILSMLLGYVLANIKVEKPSVMAAKIMDGIGDAGRGMVIIGILLAGAQILVSMINLTGIGVTLSSLIVTFAGDSLFLVALIVGGVCLIMGMGLPTTAAYVLVAAVLAPAMIDIGVEPLTAHMFVFYFATLSVITPPVCVAVFVAAGIAKANWLPAAFEAVRLTAVVYFVPFLFLLYPGFVGLGTTADIVQAALLGLVLMIAVPALLGGRRLTGVRILDSLLLLVIIVLAVIPGWISLGISMLGLGAMTVALRLLNDSTSQTAGIAP
jgi:TRAP transporter 4TM/12TM fusion protein